MVPNKSLKDPYSMATAMAAKDADERGLLRSMSTRDDAREVYAFGTGATACGYRTAAQAQADALYNAAQAYDERTPPERAIVTLVYSINKELRIGTLDIGGGISVVAIETQRQIDTFETLLRFILELPDGRKKIFLGPVNLFINCKDLKEIIIRGLEVAEER